MSELVELVEDTQNVLDDVWRLEVRACCVWLWLWLWLWLCGCGCVAVAVAVWLWLTCDVCACHFCFFPGVER